MAITVRMMPVLLASVSLASLAAGAAHAQAGPAQGPAPATAPATVDPAPGATGTSTDTAEVVVVTGFRSSLSRSISIKRNETSIVEAINAEDIGDFPDLNLAEAMQRIPGVQIDRDGGEGRSINVRGLSSDFVRVQINGMEALATTGGRDGRANRNRQFDFNVFAAEMFSSVRVVKSQEAGVDEGSLGATVQLRTARPFDYDGFTFAVGGQASYNDLAQQTDPRATFLVSNRFMDGTLGVLVSGAYSTRNTFEEGHSSGRFRVPADDGCVPSVVAGVTRYVNTTRCYQSVGQITTASGTVLTGPAAEEAAWRASHPRIPRYGRIGYQRERLGLTATVQWSPTPATMLTFETLYAQLDQTRNEEFLEVIGFAREAGVQGFRTVDLVRGRVDGRGNLVSATFDDVDIRTEQRIDILSTTFTQTTLSFEHDFSDTFTASGLIGASNALGDNPQQTTISLERYDVDGYSYDYSNPSLPAFNYGFDVTNPANYVFSASTALGDASLIRLRPNETENSYETARIDFAWQASDVASLSFGASVKRFGFEVTEFRRANEGVPASVLTAFAARGIAPSAYTTLLTGFGRGMDLPPGTDTRWVIPDLNALRAITGFDCNCVNDFGDFRLALFDGETRRAEETSTGFYIQLDWSLEYNGIGFRGNAGLRQVTTELEATGILNGLPTTVTNTYADTLPALNMVLEPMDGLLVRFAAARTMARPNLASLTPGGSIDATPPGLSLTSGNPNLEPIRSDNLDLSIEWYPYREGLFAVAFFSKDIESFIQRLRRTVSFSETGFPVSLLGPGVTVNDQFDVTSFVNTRGGRLTGYEITVQTPLTFLPEALSGFGVLLNYTSIESEFEYIVNPTTLATVRQPLVGQSAESFSATLYFERGPFEARVSATYRGEYLTTVPAQSGNDVEGKAATTNINFSASWDINDRLEISFEGLNLTDEYDDRWINSVRKNNLNYEHTGREFVVGVRYKF